MENKDVNRLKVVLAEKKRTNKWVNAAKPYFLSVSKNFWMSSSGDIG